MKTKFALYVANFAFVAILILTSHLAYSQSTVTGSGNWDDANLWDPVGVPDANTTQALIPNGYVVDKDLTGTSRAQLRVGSTVSGGTLNISNGIISSASTAVSVHEIATANNSTGTINVVGGTLRTTSSNGGGMRVGVGNNSSGLLNISSGTITATSGIHLGVGQNSTGTMTVSGGTVTTSTGTGSGMNNNLNPNFFVGSLNADGENRNGVFTQTGGTVAVSDGHDGVFYFFSVGNARAESHNITGTATLSGGSFTGNIRVGRDANITTAGGSGLLAIGPGATVQGQSQAWEVSANGTLEFRLGANDSFNAVDLTTVTTAEAIMFTQAGATLSIDGSELPFSLDYDPINLIAYASGKGPSLDSLGNVNYSFVGFAPGLTPSLEWTDTALVLVVIPEPATTALLLGMFILGGVAFARRRCKQV